MPCLYFDLVANRPTFFLHDKPMCSQETSCTDNTIEHWTEFNHPRSPCKQGVMCSNTSNTAHMKFTHTPHTQLHSFTLFLLRIRKTLCTDKRPSAHTEMYTHLCKWRGRPVHLHEGPSTHTHRDVSPRVQAALQAREDVQVPLCK